MAAGMDEARVPCVLDHYRGQAEDEAVAEDEATLQDPGQALIEVPRDLVPVVRALIAKHVAA
jgi:hypothetical protein